MCFLKNKNNNNFISLSNRRKLLIFSNTCSMKIKKKKKVFLPHSVDHLLWFIPICGVKRLKNCNLKIVFFSFWFFILLLLFFSSLRGTSVSLKPFHNLLKLLESYNSPLKGLKKKIDVLSHNIEDMVHGLYFSRFIRKVSRDPLRYIIHPSIHPNTFYTRVSAAHC